MVVSPWGTRAISDSYQRTFAWVCPLGGRAPRVWEKEQEAKGEAKVRVVRSQRPSFPWPLWTMLSSVAIRIAQGTTVNRASNLPAELERDSMAGTAWDAVSPGPDPMLSCKVPHHHSSCHRNGTSGRRRTSTACRPPPSPRPKMDGAATQGAHCSPRRPSTIWMMPTRPSCAKSWTWAKASSSRPWLI